ncbi:MAG: Ig-like domain-containing protein, partial [Candidatus Poribacteria bacterium]|nr:Ig-like domain-containing protein [Candidatus Poribacteria bacterium]
MRKQGRFCFLLLVTLISTLLPQAGQAQADSLLLSGTVKNVDGTVAGAGYSVVTENQRVKSGWFAELTTETRDDGTFSTNFIDVFGPNKTEVGDQIIITVTEIATGKIKGKKTYTVTVADVDAMEASVEVMLSGITTTFVPAEVLADGKSTSAITISVQDEGEPVLDDTLTLIVAEGAVGDVINNGDGTYSTVYTAPSVEVSGAKAVAVSIESTKLDQEI